MAPVPRVGSGCRVGLCHCAGFGQRLRRRDRGLRADRWSLAGSRAVGRWAGMPSACVQPTL